MKITGELKEKLKSANTAEEKMKILSDLGITLTEDELDLATGGLADDPDGAEIHMGKPAFKGET